MAINVQYGDIASALGLANTAGKNQGDQQRFKNFVSFADLQQQAQNESDRKNANQIQNALATSHLQEQYATSQDQLQAQNQHSLAQQQLAQAQMQQQNQYHQALLGEREQSIQNSSAYRNRRADQFQQGLDRNAGNDQLKQNAIGQLPPEQAIQAQATGRLYPGHGGNPDDAREKNLMAEFMQLQKLHGSAVYDPNDINKMGQQQSQSVPGAVAGKEAAFQIAQGRMPQIQAELAAIQQRREQVAMGSPVQQGTQGLNPSAVAQNAQQPQQAPPQGPGSKTMPIHISGAQDYVQVPPGSFYIDPEGNTRQKS